MRLFEFLRPKPKQKSEKHFTLDNLKAIIDLTVVKADADKLKLFLDKRLKSHIETKSALRERDEFDSQEIIDFMYAGPIYFYGFFDWKEDSKEFDYYIRNALKRNFNIELSNTPVCNLDELQLINQIYRLYGTELEKHQITLCSIDTNSDSYQVILIKTEEYPKLFELVKLLGYHVEHYSEQW